ncbi:hypothetical protein DV495_004329 [Geotrichum candidum]|uniref:Similar to Saccharomyces cerevisiae YPL249C GYP5 GTPase-activating protein (GAP) for yeast Rab family members n=1 Tax=Geotrichum candidum TaxID=1173061 RepID=A0A0J9XCZ3_GEOCN|nr:hypothetical protein DV452_002852 [Geotrichum candidum]KAI9212608.1 hypothetical protein DS838_002522 [Geotrichum bryndzae]KAF5121498.1 hypothetical protein DV495_004329 [Geotrichum candidum]KAF7501623.1 hypothetical protein DV113_000354 [Geotrichum candidum]KAI8131804.1 hypothetical protein DUD61_004537 [Geotrichum candidum]
MTEDNPGVVEATLATEIDWDSLIKVEDRMALQDEDEAPTTSLVTERLKHISEDFDDAEPIVLSITELKEVISESSTMPFNDIPNLQIIKYDDGELQFWQALLAEYKRTAERLPRLASIMVRSGIPPALRGLAWKSMAQGGSPTLGSLYDSLSTEWTPFVKIIGRDLNRTFPDIKTFREKGGEGQVKLGRVLRAYSAYDMQVGYCQGLTFLTGPLLLHMSDKDAFCALVRLMEDYDLRSMFTADMSGLPVRMYQFDELFKAQFPDLYQHFTVLKVNNIYASQWFLSFFAVTCPLAMLVRIFDLTFAEGAIPTMMRVALAVLKRNQATLLKFSSDEEILKHMLGRTLWDIYHLDADLLMADVSDMTICTYEKLDDLAEEFRTGKKKVEQPYYSFQTWFKWSAAPPSATASTASLVPSTFEHKSKPSIAETIKAPITTTKEEETPVPPTPTAPTVDKFSKLMYENQTLKEQIESLSTEIETLKYELTSLDKTEHEHGDNDAEDSDDAVNQCCESLRVELAVAKTNEVFALQRIEELRHSLHTLNTGPSTSNSNITPAPVEDSSEASTAAAPASAAKGWSIW